MKRNSKLLVLIIVLILISMQMRDTRGRFIKAPRELPQDDHTFWWGIAFGVFVFIEYAAYTLGRYGHL